MCVALPRTLAGTGSLSIVPGGILTSDRPDCEEGKSVEMSPRLPSAVVPERSPARCARIVGLVRALRSLGVGLAASRSSCVTSPRCDVFAP